MNTKRIEEIQKETAYPDSISVQQALLKVWNECEQGKVVKNNAVLQVMPRIYLAILNITSWVGQCGDAEHVYAHLILSEKENVNIDNVEEFNVNYLGEKIELRRPLTLELAKQLDKKDGHNSNQRAYRICNEDPEFAKENPDYGKTNRFDTFEQAVNAGIEKWKELNINCPFISLYEGEKYKANSYEPSTTVVLQYGA